MAYLTIAKRNQETEQQISFLEKKYLKILGRYDTFKLYFVGLQYPEDNSSNLLSRHTKHYTRTRTLQSASDHFVLCTV